MIKEYCDNCKREIIKGNFVVNNKELELYCIDFLCFVEIRVRYRKNNGAFFSKGEKVLCKKCLYKLLEKELTIASWKEENKKNEKR